MQDAFDEVLRGRKRKRNRAGRYLLAHRDEVIAKLRAEIVSGTFELGPYHEREVLEAGKVRTYRCCPWRSG